MYIHNKGLPCSHLTISQLRSTRDNLHCMLCIRTCKQTHVCRTYAHTHNTHTHTHTSMIYMRHMICTYASTYTYTYTYTHTVYLGPAVQNLSNALVTLGQQLRPQGHKLAAGSARHSSVSASPQRGGAHRRDKIMDVIRLCESMWFDRPE